MAGRPPLVEMRGIGKSFPGVVALDAVDLDLQAGEVHVLLGENGAGKSTLIKILGGAVKRDRGSICLDGSPVEITNPRSAQRLGISIIYQELNLVPCLSVAENIFLGREPQRLGLVDRRTMRDRAAKVLDSLGVAIDVTVTVERLGIAEQQMVEVAKALSERCRVLILDEPTSALTTPEIERLFATLGRLQESGVGMLYISHRLEEMERIGDRVTVLRDGRRVGCYRVGEVATAELVRIMADRELTDHFPKERTAPGEELLRVEGLSRPPRLADVSFTLRRGEVLGVAGLLGAGRTELARILAGADRPAGGRIEVRGRPVRIDSPRAALRLGLGFLPEDRKTQGLVLDLSVGRNLTLPSARRLARAGVVRRHSEERLARHWCDELRIKTPSLGRRTALLSGGNQQKVVLAKWLALDCEILVMDEPTRGVDVGAKVEIYRLMNRLTAAGAGILMISSELPEVLSMSDRILVLHRGRLAAELDAADATQESILRAAVGHAA